MGHSFTSMRRVVVDMDAEAMRRLQEHKDMMEQQRLHFLEERRAEQLAVVIQQERKAYSRGQKALAYQRAYGG